MSTVQGAVRQSDWIAAGGGGGWGGVQEGGGSEIGLVAAQSLTIPEKWEEGGEKSSGHILMKFGHSHMCLNKGGL